MGKLQLGRKRSCARSSFSALFLTRCPTPACCTARPVHTSLPHTGSPGGRRAAQGAPLCAA
eukprot:359182-Chlamydomonas_euryale.AAC.3